MKKIQPDKDAVYILEKSPYANGVQIVLNVTDLFKQGYICFDDTNRGHMIKGNVVSQCETSFVFLDDRNEEWEFVEISIETFRKEFYKLIVNGDLIREQCNTTEELWKYFREQFPM